MTTDFKGISDAMTEGFKRGLKEGQTKVLPEVTTILDDLADHEHRVSGEGFGQYEPDPDVIAPVEFKSDGVKYPFINGWPEPELSSSDEWSTPKVIFEQLHAELRFTLDGAASAANAKLPAYLTKEMDAPSLNVGKHRVFLNPPYSRGNLYRFVTWARRQAQKGALVCCLVPAYTCERWWQDNVARLNEILCETWHEEKLTGRWTVYDFVDLRVSVLFPPGRMKFVEASGATGPARFSSAVLVFEPPGGRQDS